MSGLKTIVGGVLLVIAIVAATVASNKSLDAYGIASAKGLTVEQQKEKAKRNQYDWDHFQYDK
jgi:hypothetical protein